MSNPKPKKRSNLPEMLMRMRKIKSMKKARMNLMRERNKKKRSRKKKITMKIMKETWRKAKLWIATV